jgi:2-dehydro-3-deoxy-D-gluconate 5-dehydrogenase
MNIPSFRLDGRVALVTGAGSGMGKAFANAFAQAGADVALTELPGKEDLAEATATEVRAAGRRALVIPLDVCRLPMIQTMVDRVVGEWGQIDIAVNNAGMNVRKMAVDVTEDDWDRVLDTDLKGVFFCAQAVGRHMIERGKGGKIVNMASQIGLVAYHSRIAYCCAKAGVINMTRVLAYEWAKYKINVNAVAPTFVNTPFVAKLLQEDAELRQDVINRIPLGRVAEPEDVVGAVVYLAGPASDMVTGHTLLVDGGWTAI